MSDFVHLLPDAAGAASGMIHSLRDIDSEHAARERLRFLAYHDSLTGLAVREVAERHLERLLDQESFNDSCVAVLFIDLDDLKTINDLYGHAVGDQVISEVATRIAGTARNDDLVARFGGDEFVVLLPSVRTANDARTVAEKMREAANRPITARDTSISTGVSIGVALSRPGADPADTLRRADAALYRAKRAGRNSVVLDPTVGVAR